MTHEPQAAASCCSSTPKTAAPEDSSTCASTTADTGATTCPVMVGNAVDKAAAVAAGLFRDFAGERYYFCCAGCGPAFDADPAKYAANMA
ncbi:hypothetical protein [Leucobacter sp. M11]|uniref:hypothetical protein n=1 Tax=Leucobacter sp. M11 TaxID=2993565 RepID=UPI002D7F94E1|nr:hypothetical protein [Leucobacter sp. M11]MEB4613635.1 YHS domain-containing protein [Leucobacter sp. M11]